MKYSGDSLDTAIVLCRKCNVLNLPGTDRCKRCNARLFPLLLGVVTFFSFLGVLFFFFSMLFAKNITFSVHSAIVAAIVVTIFIITLSLLYSLRRGKYSAWRSIQIFFALHILLILLSGMASFNRSAPYATISGLESFIVALFYILFFWTYLYVDQVRAFCSVGKNRSIANKKLSEATKMEIKGDFQKAIELYEQIIRDYPDTDIASDAQVSIEVMRKHSDGN